ncbi:hypothetical protein LXA43DRAFT_900718, partial [Ganoderma leucocontextum]
IDLSPCNGLQELWLELTPHFSMETHAGFVKELLASWKPSRCPNPALWVRAFHPSPKFKFTRQSFADILRSFSTIAEKWLRTVEEQSPAGGSEDHHRSVQYQLTVQIFDVEVEKHSWLRHLVSCFPTWLQLGRLYMDFRTRE